jgi:hypothetical protein
MQHPQPLLFVALVAMLVAMLGQVSLAQVSLLFPSDDLFFFFSASCSHSPQCSCLPPPLELCLSLFFCLEGMGTNMQRLPVRRRLRMGRTRHSVRPWQRHAAWQVRHQQVPVRQLRRVRAGADHPGVRGQLWAVQGVGQVKESVSEPRDSTGPQENGRYHLHHDCHCSSLCE